MPFIEPSLDRHENHRQPCLVCPKDRIKISKRSVEKQSCRKQKTGQTLVERVTDCTETSYPVCVRAAPVRPLATDRAPPSGSSLTSEKDCIEKVASRAPYHTSHCIGSSLARSSMCLCKLALLSGVRDWCVFRLSSRLVRTAAV